ncbi:hypothetical protein [Parachlamydia sp. AcF125]|uniref:hypothetical protein n=1 Tax=Parachlamydia sp. AcF125 TaxID=2795736 RepID=UPI002016430D|nr:hypothetical protein [Parachlamydia sp. AcF125]
MRHQPTKSPSHLANSAPIHFYHRTDSLLFQFILCEFIAVHREIQVMKTILLKMRQPDPNSQDEFASLLNTLTLATRNLSGSAQEHMRFFAWNLEVGALTKLRNYCTFFSQNKENSDKAPMHMQRYANRAWLFCLQSLDYIRLLQHNLFESVLPVEKVFEANNLLILTLEKLFSQIQHLTRLIARVSLTFRRDENILYFILQQKEGFDQIYEKNFVKNLFEKMFENGVPGAGQFLLQKYGERGFFDLLPLIASKITELQIVVVA